MQSMKIHGKLHHSECRVVTRHISSDPLLWPFTVLLLDTHSFHKNCSHCTLRSHGYPRVHAVHVASKTLTTQRSLTSFRPGCLLDALSPACLTTRPRNSCKDPYTPNDSKQGSYARTGHRPWVRPMTDLQRLCRVTSSVQRLYRVTGSVHKLCKACKV